MNPDWLRPRWPAPAHVHALCTTRAGGASRPPYDTLNLGDHVGDDPLAVQINRSRLRQSMGAHPIFLSQCHGTHVLALADDTAHGLSADGCFTDRPGLACTIMVADCLPVLFTDAQGHRVGAAHAGWRGLAGAAGQGILEALAAQFMSGGAANGAQDPGGILAWLGPCIGAEAFEVGDDVREAFVSHERVAQSMFKSLGSGKWLADLAGLARQRLHALGITQVYGNDGHRAWCTVTQASRFFSHRRDRVSGRMAACIWLS